MGLFSILALNSTLRFKATCEVTLAPKRLSKINIGLNSGNVQSGKLKWASLALVKLLEIVMPIRIEVIPIHCVPAQAIQKFTCSTPKTLCFSFEAMEKNKTSKHGPAIKILH